MAHLGTSTHHSVMGEGKVTGNKNRTRQHRKYVGDKCVKWKQIRWSLNPPHPTEVDGTFHIIVFLITEMCKDGILISVLLNICNLYKICLRNLRAIKTYSTTSAVCSTGSMLGGRVWEVVPGCSYGVCVRRRAVERRTAREPPSTRPWLQALETSDTYFAAMNWNF